jgi:hypothetical protein
MFVLGHLMAARFNMETPGSKIAPRLEKSISSLALPM